MKTLKYADDNHHNFIFVAKRKIRRMFNLDRLLMFSSVLFIYMNLVLVLFFQKKLKEEFTTHRSQNLCSADGHNQKNIANCFEELV